MDIEFTCSKCGQGIAVEETDAGLTVNCPTCNQDLVVPSPPKSKSTNLPPNPAISKTKNSIPTPRQGAVIGGWICYALAVIITILSGGLLFFIYGPLYLVSFILAIVAISQRRLVNGIVMILANLIGVPILIAILFMVVFFSKKESPQKLISASESPINTGKTAISSHAENDNEPINQKKDSLSPDNKGSRKDTPVTALDMKGGFREYRLGMNKNLIVNNLKEYESNTDKKLYEVDNIDTAVGAFKIKSISLEFDQTLNILKEVIVDVKGKQNVAGMLETFTSAYGKPEINPYNKNLYVWKGSDIKLTMMGKNHYSDEETAIIFWESQKVNKLIEDELKRRAKEGASEATKGL